MILRIIAYSIFSFLIFLASFFTLLAILEWGGISNFFLKKVVYQDKLLIHETNYYGKKLNLKEDPYTPYIVQHLHPYYIFGMNWRKNKNTEFNNSIVNLDRDGFRKSLNFENKKNEIIVLGGSSAFGIGSSSDEKTISSFISSKTKYNALNRAYSAWNSHQELISLVKYNKNFKYSLSFTGTNDFHNFCVSPGTDRNNFPDLPESFIVLGEYFDDLRAKSILTFNKKIKKFLIYNFPDTKKIYTYYKKKYQNRNLDNLNSSEFCGGKKEVDKIINQFLANQSSIKKFSNASGAEHWIVIQPILTMHDENYNKKTRQMLEYFITTIMNSDICITNCLDLSNFFAEPEKKDYLFSRDNSDYNKAIFLDNAHLLDHATEKVVDKIIDTIKFN